MNGRRLLPIVLLPLLFGCARQTTPTGGPQDKTPPKLVRSIPEQNQKNFNEKTLTLTFDENIQLKNPREDIIFAPSPGKDINYTAKQNRVTIQLKTPLADTTTYSISFRDAVQDLTEGNPAENLRLAFSTGPVIDSLSIRGKIVNAIDEKIPQKITVAIYSSDTFNIFKHAPVYFTKTDKEGHFNIGNLKAGSYRLYAFDDKNKNLKLETQSEKFGFQPGRIHLTKTIDSITMALVLLDSRPLKLASVRNSQKTSVAKFNKRIVTYNVASQKEPIPNSFAKDHAEINFFHYSPITDSVGLKLHAVDSLDQAIDTLIYIKEGKALSLPDPFRPDPKDPKIQVDPPSFSTTIAFNKPVVQLILDSMFLRLDTIHTIPLTAKNLSYDTLINELKIFKPFNKKTFDSLPSTLQLYLGPNTFISIDADSSKAITLSASISQPVDLASLSLEVVTQEKNFKVELLLPDYKVQDSFTNAKSRVFKNVPPGQYQIRVTIDTNGNGKWDPGNILKDIPPEQTFFYKNTDGKYLFPLRANWEVGPYTLKF